MDGTGSSPTIIQPADPNIGKVLGNEFRLTRLLGKGGMGAVYLGEQLSLMRPVAVKLLPPAATQDNESAQRFQREAVAAARLQHPNIVQVYFFGQHEGQRFIAMEYVEGESLYGYMKRKKRLSLDESLKIVREVARGLGAAHKQGLVHRDVKPENVFISKEGRVKLGDFGLARDTVGDSRLSVTGQVMGTPYYMPPEQCRGQKVDSRADVYALGATLFHMVTGEPPYQGESAFDIMSKHVSQPVPPPEAFGQGVPPAVVELVRKMMAKDPAERPATMDEVVASLSQILTANPPAVRGQGKPPSTASIKAIKSPTAFASKPAQSAVKEPLSPFERNLRWYAIGAGVVMIGLVAGLWKFAHGGTPSPAPVGQTVANQPSTPPPPVTPPTPADPTPKVGQEPPWLNEARDRFEKGEFGLAIRIIDDKPPVWQIGPFADKIRALRAQALSELTKRVDNKLQEVTLLVGRRQFEQAAEVLKGLESIPVPELAAKLKEARAQLEHAQKASVATDADWAKLATEAWGLAQQRKWKEAAARCADAEKDPSFAAFLAPIANLRSLIDGARQAEEEMIRGLQAQKGKTVSFPLRTGADVNGTLTAVEDSGDCKVEPAGGGQKIDVPFASIPPGELMKLIREWRAADASHGVAVLIWTLARGDFEFADSYLTLDSSAADTRKAIEPSSAGWKAPWSAEELDARQKDREKVAPDYAKLASAAWQKAQHRHWDEAIDACRRARQDGKLAPVAGRVACLGQILEMGRELDVAIVKSLKDKQGKMIDLPRRQGGDVKGVLTEVTDSGDCTVHAQRGKAPPTTLHLTDISAERLTQLAHPFLQKEENALADQITWAMAVGDFEVGDRDYKWLTDNVKGITWFDIASQGWDAAPWSASSRKARGK